MYELIDIADLENIISKEDNTTLIAYLIIDCYHCQTVDKYIDEIEKEFDEVKVIRFKLKNEEEFSKRNKIFLYPVILVYKEGDLKRRVEGYMNKKEIIELIKPSV